jgi:hypothetical protein
MISGIADLARYEDPIAVVLQMTAHDLDRLKRKQRIKHETREGESTSEHYPVALTHLPQPSLTKVGIGSAHPR